MNKTIAFIRIVRPVNFLITFFTVIVAAAISYQGVFHYSVVLTAALTAALTMSAGNIINDIFDINGDSINHPGRPLPSGIISHNEAVTIYIILVAVTIFLSWFVTELNFIINITANIILFLYSWQFKRIPLGKNFVVSLLTGLVFIYGGLAVNSLYFAVVPALFAFMINLVREIVKDMEDLKGDTLSGIVSFPSRFGMKTAKYSASALGFLLIIFTFFPYVKGVYDKDYLLVLLVFVIPGLIYFLISINKDDSQKNLNKLSLLLKLDMVFGLIAIYLGR
jgi:geranylgeranylglycerol-phosphate geranylgeranyltransferase